MKKKSTSTILCAIFCVLSLLAPKPGKAWGVTGHRVVGQIAQQHLSPKAKAGVAALIGRQSLALWSNWPDFIKSDTTHQWDSASPWHYVDLPGNMEKQAFVTQLKALEGKNLYSQINTMLRLLKNKKLPLTQRREALAFLVHFVGDLHQPLHVGRDEDQGGNKITVFWFEKKTNLHSLWDAALIDFQQYSYTEYAHELDIAPKAQEQAWQKTSREDWFYESHMLSDKIYALSPADAKLSFKYNYLFKQDLDNQLLKGGLRLAALLNKAFE